MTSGFRTGGRRHVRDTARYPPSGGTVWLFGRHAVQEALLNPRREKIRLIVTRNSAEKLQEAIAISGVQPEIGDPRTFPAPLDPSSVHQGAALETKPLEWGSLKDICTTDGNSPLVVLLDRVTDPHNVGAVIRSADAFGACAVVAPVRNSPAETGALAKSASGALERIPYLRVHNLGNAIETLKAHGYTVIGLESGSDQDLQRAMRTCLRHAVAIAIGAEGPGLRQLTRSKCDLLAYIPSAGTFDSLNVSNAAAIALYVALMARQEE